jgi:hypothetical protein
MTDDDRLQQRLAEHRCPDCDGFIFRPGPRGGASQNIECIGCGSRFNVAHFFGQVVLAQRVENTGEWREDMFPKVCQ